MTLYYCTSMQEWSDIVCVSDLYQGTTIDEEIDPTFANEDIFIAKAETAQGELEQLLACRFRVSILRQHPNYYLKYCHAIIILFHLEMNGTIRSLVQTKYDLVTSFLIKTDCILDANGIKVVGDSVKDPNRRGALVGDRKLDLVPVHARYRRVPDKEIPTRPTIWINPRC